MAGSEDVTLSVKVDGAGQAKQELAGVSSEVEKVGNVAKKSAPEVQELGDSIAGSFSEETRQKIEKTLDELFWEDE